MFADSRDELLLFAKKIGLRPEWIQEKHKELIHFDLIENKRNQAVMNGAIEISRRKFFEIWKKRRAENAGN